MAGVAIVFAVLAVWIVLVLAGWSLVFSSTDGAIRDSQTNAPADLVDRLYFAGYTVFTLGNGDYVPGDGVWQLATVMATGTGLMLVTLSITYLVPVASAVALRRQLASYIASLGDTPHAIVINGWNGSSFSALGQHLVALAPLIHTARQQHLAYPVLHYFHSQHTESAAAPNLTNLSQALDLIGHGVARGARPDTAIVDPVDRAIGSFLDTLSRAYLSPAEPIAPPALGPLGEAGIPLTSDEDYRGSVGATEQRRSLLGAMLADDGWSTDGRSA